MALAQMDTHRNDRRLEDSRAAGIVQIPGGTFRIGSDHRYLTDTRPPEERGWVGRSLLPSRGAGWERIELGANKVPAGVRDHVPGLCSDQSVFRKNVKAARRRDRQLDKTERS